MKKKKTTKPKDTTSKNGGSLKPNVSSGLKAHTFGSTDNDSANEKRTATKPFKK